MDDLSECDNFLSSLKVPTPTRHVPEPESSDIKEFKKFLEENDRISSSEKFTKTPLGAYFFDAYLKNSNTEASPEEFSKFLKSPKFNDYMKYAIYSRRNFNFDDFDILLPLGRGALGMVEAVKRCSTGSVYALKRMCKRMIKEKKCKKYCIMEKEILSSVHSPFVVEMVHSFQTDDYIFIIMECHAGGNLEFNIERHGQFSEEWTKYYAAEVALGLHALHKEGIVYRDMKSENILLDLDGHAHISDLGIAMRLEKGKMFKRKIGTTGWWAPEIVKEEKADFRCDWFSFGVLLWNMLTGENPFLAEAARTQKHPDDLIKEGWIPDVESLECSSECKACVRAFLEPDPKKRIGFSKLKEQEWFKGFDWETAAKQTEPPPCEPSHEEANTSHSLKGDFDIPDLELDEEDRVYDNWNYHNTTLIERELVRMLETGTSYRERQNSGEHRRRKRAAKSPLATDACLGCIVS